MSNARSSAPDSRRRGDQRDAEIKATRRRRRRGRCGYRGEIAEVIQAKPSAENRVGERTMSHVVIYREKWGEGKATGPGPGWMRRQTNKRNRRVRESTGRSGVRGNLQVRMGGTGKHVRRTCKEIYREKWGEGGSTGQSRGYEPRAWMDK
jgi:hypothetical protein